MSSTMSTGLRGYRDLLARPPVGRVIGTGLIARLPIGMTALALILLIRGDGGTYGDAGIVSAAEAIAAAAGAPVAGRLVDRHSPRVVLMTYAAIFCAAMLVLVGLSSQDAPLAALVLVAAVGGFTLPPIGPTVRMLWPSMVTSENQLSTAFALEATLQELLFVAGPLIVGLLTAIFSPSAGVIAAGVLSLFGVMGFVATGPVRDHRSEEHPPRHFLSALSPKVVQRVLMISAGFGVVFGSYEVAIPAFAETHGGRSLGAIALACWSGGSLVGGLLAAGHAGADPRRRLRFTSTCLAVAVVFPLFATSLPMLAVLMFFVGLPVAPGFAMTYRMVQQSAVPGTQAEVFGWLSTAIVVGIAFGTALGGHLITQAGSSASMKLGILGAVIAAAIAALPLHPK
jgi:predicted MFS family arabinose efflux permease